MGGRDGVLIGRRLVVRPLMRSSPVFSFFDMLFVTKTLRKICTAFL
jgi:hypothetical protein